MLKANEKLQWQKPVVKELDIAKTMGGVWASQNEKTFATFPDGTVTDIHGAES